MFVLRFYTILALTFFSFSAHCQSHWILKRDDDGIFIYESKADTAKINAIKVETELVGRAEDLVSILMDVGNHSKWAYGTKSASVLKRISDKEIIFYKEIKSPALMVSERDLIIQMKVIGNASSKSTVVESFAIPDFIPLKKNLVRVPTSNEKWIITPLANGRIKIDYFLQFDPGGALPPMLVNLFVTKGPHDTFMNLKELLKDRWRKSR